MKLINWIFNRIMLASFRRENKRFRQALADISGTQTRILLSLLKENAQSTYGRQYDFSGITSIEEYQAKVPHTVYSDYVPYIDNLFSGTDAVLTAEKVLLLEPSSGSTAPSKYIPYTQTLKKQFQSGVSPWLYDLYTKVPGLLWGKAYWSITPAAAEKRYTPGGIPIGFEEDAQYLGGLQQHLLNHIFAIPKEVREVDDIAAFRYITLLFLLKTKDLTLISVWNPSFLMLLLTAFEGYSDRLVTDLATGKINAPGKMAPALKNTLEKKLGVNVQRATEVQDILAAYRTDRVKLYQALWPQLELISCWTDANAAPGAKELQRYFPRVKIQGKGLLATEGIVSFPIVGAEGALLSINSHFYEFIEYDSGEQPVPRIKLAHELAEGKIYSVVLTTGGGLYRYRLHDLVKVVGFTGGCPRLVFVGKEDRISDCCGEKLNELHVRELLERLFQKYDFNPSFFMLAPEMGEQGTYYYVLFMETSENETNRNETNRNELNPKNVDPNVLVHLVTELETGLQDNFHYQYCRHLGQLDSLKAYLIKSDGDSVGTTIYHEVCRTWGQKAGDIKPTALHPKTGWSKKFPGDFFEWEGRF